MFKKADDVRERSGKSAMRKKDVQNLKAALLSQMPRLAESQEALSALLSGGEVTQCKLVTKTIVYYVDNAPMVFDEQGRNRLFPSVLFLFLFPSCLRTYVIHGPVSRFVLKGADLMLPGLATLEGLDGILVDERVSIRIVGNPLPFAVAQSTTTWSSILESPRKGRACEVVHLFGDFLVPVSPQSIARANVGFEKKGVVTSLPSFTDTVTSDFGDEDFDEGSDGGREDGDGDECEEGGGEELSVEDTQDSATDKDKDKAEPGPSDSALPAASPAANPPSDWLLSTALALLVKHHIKPKHLPMLVSSFWPLVLRAGSYLQANPQVLKMSDEALASCSASSSSAAIAACVLEVKKTLHRSALSFLQQMAKEGVLQLSSGAGSADDKDAGDGAIYVSGANALQAAVLQGVRLSNADDFRAAVAAVAGDTSSGAGGSSSSVSSAAVAMALSGASGGGQSVRVTELYKLPKALREMFASTLSLSAGTNAGGGGGGGGGGGAPLTESRLFQPLRFAEVKELLTVHFRVHGLESPGDRSCVSVPPSDGLYKLAAAAAATVAAAAAATAAERVQRERQHRENDDEDLVDYDPRLLNAHLAATSLGGDGCMVAGVWLPSNGSAPCLAGPGIGAQPSVASQSRPWKPTDLSSRKASGGGSGGGGAGSAARITENSMDSSSLPPPPTPTQTPTPTAQAPAPGQAPAPVTIKKDALMRAVVSKLSQAYSVVLPSGEERVGSGSPPSIDISVQVVRGNKYTTHVRGLEELLGTDISRVRELMAKKFATSCSIGPATINPKIREIMVQGNMGRECEDLLTEACGVPRSLVKLEHAKGVKGSKKK